MAYTGEIFVGQQVQLTATFRNDAGELMDPETVEMLVIDGESQKHTLVPVREETGVWSARVTAACSGRWTCRAAGAGASPLVVEETFTVSASAFLP